MGYLSSPGSRLYGLYHIDRLESKGYSLAIGTLAQSPAGPAQLLGALIPGIRDQGSGIREIMHWDEPSAAA